jgi:hypothetical protein
LELETWLTNLSADKSSQCRVNIKPRGASLIVSGFSQQLETTSIRLAAALIELDYNEQFGRGKAVIETILGFSTSWCTGNLVNFSPKAVRLFEGWRTSREHLLV